MPVGSWSEKRERRHQERCSLVRSHAAPARACGARHHRVSPLSAPRRRSKEKQLKRKEAKAETAAQLDQSIEKELLARLQVRRGTASSLGAWPGGRRRRRGWLVDSGGCHAGAPRGKGRWPLGKAQRTVAAPLGAPSSLGAPHGTWRVPRSWSAAVLHEPNPTGPPLRPPGPPQSGTYGDIYNFPQRQYEAALAQEEVEDEEREAAEAAEEEEAEMEEYVEGDEEDEDEVGGRVCVCVRVCETDHWCVRVGWWGGGGCGGWVGGGVGGGGRGGEQAAVELTLQLGLLDLSS